MVYSQVKETSENRFILIPLFTFKIKKIMVWKIADPQNQELLNPDFYPFQNSQNVITKK